MISNAIEGLRPSLQDDGASAVRRARAAGHLAIAFVNNMGPSGFEVAERQFQHLIALGAGRIPWQFCRFTLGPVEGRVGASYAGIEAIWDTRPDALVITGAEPRCADLRDEGYWGKLTELLNWAEALRIPVLLSCLAAHAAVLHWDGIARRRLPVKRSGVFHHKIVAEHPLLDGLASPAIPHSRWNEIDAAALSACGYQILTQAEDGSVDCFVRHERHLVLGFQGHPEYDSETLFLEFRRDVRRYLCGTDARYPELPVGYFSPEEIQLLAAFRDGCSAQAAERFAAFPLEATRRPYAASWQRDAGRLCGNWLRHVRARQARGAGALRRA